MFKQSPNSSINLVCLIWEWSPPTDLRKHQIAMTYPLVGEKKDVNWYQE
jgi:hypothetical protein